MRAPAAAVAVLVATSVGVACRPAPEPLRVDARTIVVHNDTAHAWTNVEVWVNDHYRVTRPRIEAGERFVIPLDAFVAGFGQRFDPRRQEVRGVEVTAASPGGPIRLVWGTGRRRIGSHEGSGEVRRGGFA